MRTSASLLSLTEEFYDFFQLLGQASLPVSQLSVILLQLARFALESEIHFSLRLEAIRTFNCILESLSREQKKLIQIDSNQNLILSQVATAVLTVGDYELQVSLSEALCRLTPRKDRQQRANRWFSSCDIIKAFCDIRDADFEVDCRQFLNFVNSHCGDQRRVYSFPCVSAFLDHTELFPPKDDKLDEFWIDFNISSGCVSFFIDEPQSFLWGSVHLQEDNVDGFSLQLKDGECTAAQTVLSVRLNNPIMHHNNRGRTVELNFNSEHHRDLEEAAGRVFKKLQSPPGLQASGGAVQVAPSARSYRRKTQQSKSLLKVLPLSSPSSEEDSSSPFKTSRSEFLFDQIRHSTPTRDSGRPPGRDEQVKGHLLSFAPGDEEGGPEVLVPSSGRVPVGAELESSSFLKEVRRRDGKKAALDSGYLSDQNEGPMPPKRRAEPQPEGEESTTLPAESSHEGAGPTEKEEEGPFDAGAEPPEEEGLFDAGAEPPEKEEEGPFDAGAEPPEEEGLFDAGAGPPKEEDKMEEGLFDARAGSSAEREEPLMESDLTSGIHSAFNNFKTQLNKHFTGCWHNVEAEILLSLKEYQQHVSSLLTAVHQHRLVLLESFESSVSDQLTGLHEDFNSLNAQILSFLQSERQRLGSFCEENLQRLRSLESGEAATQPRASQ
ncbi:synaptonemal complex protein 2-like [Clinocottus analis]|uniref:synaptonemal complex protein 2-like n=1 Tax=Clinocottus analis TaxID=304258 RepID=UPI0035C0A574